MKYSYLLFCVLTLSAHAAAPNPNNDLYYARELMAMGLGEYAEVVLDRAKHSAGEDYYLMKIEMMTTTKKGILEAEKFIAGLNPNEVGTWKMKLALADGYYAWGKYADVKEIYSAYVEKFGDNHSGIETEFKNATYKYAQMMNSMGDPAAALAVYDVALTAKLEKHEKRQLLAEKAEIALRLAEKISDVEEREKMCVLVDGICDDLIWVRDLWFAKAIVMRAHVKVLRGDNEGAMSLLEEYMPVIESIDKQLRAAGASSM